MHCCRWETAANALCSLTCSTFSADASLMAAGFEESYVQVWSLKGEPLRGLKENFEQSNIRDGEQPKLAAPARC